MRFDLSANCFADTDVRADAWAVIGADRTLRWHELAEQAHAWAALARAHGFAADVPVIIRGHKEAAFFVAMVGALLLGAPFVPVDTIYPDERMQRIASTLGAQMYFDAHESRFVSLNGQGARAGFGERAEGASAPGSGSTSRRRRGIGIRSTRHQKHQHRRLYARKTSHTCSSPPARPVNPKASRSAAKASRR